MIETPALNVLIEVASFLAHEPTDKQLLEYRFPDEMQERIHYLLDRNREGELTSDERRELEDYVRANRFMAMLKASRKLRLKGLEPSPISPIPAAIAAGLRDCARNGEALNMNEAPERHVFSVIAAFLASDPTDEQLLAYHLPDDLAARVSHLLFLNREAELTCEQVEELDDFTYADNMFSLLKTKIRLRHRGLG